MAFIEPLDLRTLLVNTFSGSMEIFTFIAFIVIAAMAARFRMPNYIFLMMIALFVILLAQYMSGMYVLVILIAGLVVFYGLGKLVKN